jgi:hypothetical protein
MEHTEEPAIGHIIHNGLNTGEGLFRVRHIEHEEQDAGNNLNLEEYQEHRAKSVPGIDFPRQQVAMQFLVVKVFDPETSINEIDQHFYRLHKSPLSDFELVAIKLDDKIFKWLWWRATKNLAIGREAAAMTRAEELPSLILPGNNATEMRANRRQGNKTARTRLQENGRLAAVIEEMSFSRRDLTSRNNNLITAATTGDRRKETENGPS